MNRRLALLLGVLVASGAAFVLVPTARLKPQRAVRIFDRRCRGGCTDSALLRVLPGGAVPSQYATGQLSGSNGQAVTTTRASTKTCDRGPGFFDAAQLFVNAENYSLWGAFGGGTSSGTNSSPDPYGKEASLEIVSSAGATSPFVYGYGNSAMRVAPGTGSVNVKSISGSTAIYVGTWDDGTNYAVSPCIINTSTWTRCSGTAASGNYREIFVGFDPAHQPSPAFDVLVSDPKLETGSSATPYVPGSNQQLLTLSSNLPCVSPAPPGATAGGVLVEGAGTNLALWSQALDNAAWTKSGTGIAAPTVTADQAVAPDGTLTADRIDVPVNSSSANRSIVYQTFTTAAAPFTCSAFFKGVSGSGTIYLATSDGTAGAGTTTTACAFTSTAWTRCSAPRLSGNYTYCTIGVDPTLGTALPVPSSTPAISVYAWGEQGEAQQFSTSYIATTSATAPRAAETDSVTNPLPNSGAAWCVYETVTPEGGAAWSAPSTSAAWGLGTYSFANSAFSQARGDSNVYTWTNGASGGAWYGFASNAFSAGSSHRLGQCVSGTTVTEYFDGVAMSVTQGGTPVAMTGQSGNLYIGSVSSGLQIYGYVSDVCVGGVGACR